MRNALLVFVAAVLCTLVAGCITGPPMYVARTTIMEKTGQPGSSQQQRMKTLLNLATSQRVISNAANTLSALGMKHTPEKILSATTVEPVRDTSIIAIEVTLPDAKEAKVAADVIASELKKAYVVVNAAQLSQHREFLQSQAESADSHMREAYKKLDSYSRSHQGARASDPVLAKLQADATAAKDTYILMRKKLSEAVIKEKLAATASSLKTIDPAFVRPAR